MRVVQLDLLRFLAVLLVLGRHLIPCPKAYHEGLHLFTATWKRGGWIGVDLFFVLSGFLVSGLLFREYERTGSVRPGRFLVRRGFKIYPAFWVFLIVTWFFGHISNRSLQGLFGELLFLQNYVGSVWSHTWTLAVEEHFYLLLTGYVVWRLRSGRDQPFDAVPKTFLLLAAACLTGRAITYASLGYSDAHLLSPTHLRIDSLGFGVLLSYLWSFRDLRSWRWLQGHRQWWLLAAGLGLLAPAFCFFLRVTPWIPILGFTSIAVGSGAILIALLAFDERRFRPLALFGKLGAYSYSIYLWHLPVSGWSAAWSAQRFEGPMTWYAYASAYLIGSVVLGVLAAKVVEVPFLRLRDRLFPSASGALKSAGH